MEESCLLEKLKIVPDVVCQILNYLTIRDINILESSSTRFIILLDDVRFWQRKICKEFKAYKTHLRQCSYPPRDVYWELKYLGHLCHIELNCSAKCRNCFKKTNCVLLTICHRCKDWEGSTWTYMNEDNLESSIDDPFENSEPSI